jgi:hypothetical protein
MDSENDDMTEHLSGGEKKAREYADRVIDNDEAYESVVEGLGPTMRAAVNAAIERRGYDAPILHASPEVPHLVKDAESPLSEEVHRLDQYSESIAAGRSAGVQDLYRDLLANKKDPEKRAALAQALIGDTYRNFRAADYGIDPQEQQTWELVRQNAQVPVREQNDWMYRGVFPEGGQETVTRGSFNVAVTPELIAALDAYIASGKVAANYKFGAPQTSASPQERHDAISIYFLEQPSEAVLSDLVELTKPYVRGNQLLGTKIAEGFYMSEVGSIKDEHSISLVESLDSVDPAFAKAVRNETTGRDGRIGMSEAQFYALQKVAEVFGYVVTYDAVEGFSVEVR